jgi:hypothetical protein
MLEEEISSLELLLISELDELTSLEDELASLEDEKLLEMGTASAGFSILGKSPSLTQFVRTRIGRINR